MAFIINQCGHITPSSFAHMILHVPCGACLYGGDGRIVTGCWANKADDWRSVWLS